MCLLPLRPGDYVECIDGKTDLSLKRGSYYRVAEVGLHPCSCCGAPGLTLVGLNPANGEAFHGAWFRPLYRLVGVHAGEALLSTWGDDHAGPAVVEASAARPRAH